MTGRLHPALLYHITNTLGWPALRPTQAEAVAPVLAGQDVLLLAPTAGGKTEAAMLPVLSRMAVEGWRGVSVLYVCPLKALLNNLEPRLHLLASFIGARVGVWHGDIGAAARAAQKRDPPEILLTTPESIEAILISVRTDHRALLGQVRVVVVDELHAFAGDDRGWHLRFLLARLERLTGGPVQRIGLSATVGNPEALLDWLAPGRGGQVVGVSRPGGDADVVADYVGTVANAVAVLSRLHRGERRLVFADSRSRVEEVAAGLREAGVRTFVSHASLAADTRRVAEAAFGAEPDCTIVSTSTLELGLDLGNLDRVAQVGAPPTVSSFLQRMGRTGRRAGTVRNALLLATTDHELLANLAIATLCRDGFVDAAVPPANPAHIFAQQVMALVLQEVGTTRPDLHAWIGGVGAVSPGTQQAVLAHMLAAGVLVEDGGVIGMAERGEREFGRRHFSDLVAAFSSPMLLAVQHGATALGTVHPVSLARSNVRQDGGAAILALGGRSWRVTYVDWRRRRVDVVPASGGGRSRWLGGGRMMPASVCGMAERIVAGREPACTLSARAQAQLSQLRDELAFVDAASLPVVAGGGYVTAWLFAGGLASAAVSQELAALGFCGARWDDLRVTVHGADARAVSRALSTLDPAEARPELPPDLSAALKFGLCLPPHVATAVLLARSAPDGLADRLARSHRVVHVAG